MEATPRGREPPRRARDGAGLEAVDKLGAALFCVIGLTPAPVPIAAVLTPALTLTPVPPIVRALLLVR